MKDDYHMHLDANERLAYDCLARGLYCMAAATLNGQKEVQDQDTAAGAMKLNGCSFIITVIKDCSPLSFCCLSCIFFLSI